MILIAVVVGLINGLPLAVSPGLVWTIPTLVFGGIALAGAGTLIGLTGRDEQLTSTYTNVAMMTVLFFGIVPSSDFPGVFRFLLHVLPSTYMIDSLKESLVGSTHPGTLTVDLLACIAFAAVMMVWSAKALRSRSG
ncbi:MAG: ABC transporter permease [Chloroflexota bacterium]